MGARGSSSGRTPPAPPAPPVPPVQPQPPPVTPPTPPVQPKPPANPQPAVIRLDTMSDANLASFVDKAMKSRLPAGFHDDITQRMIHLAKWNDKPEVVSSRSAEAAAKKQGAIVLYRTNSASGSTTAKQYSDAFRTADTFSTGGSGGQAYGGGAYFSDKLSGSKNYGYGRRTKNPPNTIGAVLNKNAKVVNMDDLRGMMGRNWINAHPKAARKLGFSKDVYGNLKTKYSKGSYTALAMAMGYNVVRNKVSSDEHYYTVLDRSAVTTSTKNYFSSSKGMK